MQVRELGLQLDQRPIRTRDVARPACTRTHRARGDAHRFDYLRMLAHAEIVVRAPYDDIPLAVRAIPERVGELSRLALKISEHTITLLPLQSGDGRLKTRLLVEHPRKSSGGGFVLRGCSSCEIGARVEILLPGHPGEN